jgi:carboxyl-terminal processing protease
MTRTPSPLLAVALALACETKPTTPPQTPPPVADAEPAKDATASGCRDWSTLDRASLPALPAGKHTALLEQVWSRVLERHYDPTIACLDWPAIRQTYGERVAAAKTDEEAYAAIGAMLGELKQSHLGLVPPGGEVSDAPAEERAMGRGRVPIEVMMLGDDLVVAKSTWYGKKAPIPSGATIVSIDGTTLRDVVAKASERSKARVVERDFQLVRFAQAALSCDVGQSHELVWQAPGKTKTAKKKIACHVPTRRTATFGNLRDIPVEVESTLLPGTKVGYVRFNIWLMDLAADIERGIGELRGKGMESLVIDLRGNPGGVGAMVVPVGRLLLEKDADLGVMKMRGAEQRFAVKPGADPFKGPIVILVDAGTASTSEIFAQAMKDLGRAKIVGPSESQGAALPSVIEKLDGGAMLQYVVGDYTSPAGVAVEGKGVEPDVRVTVTREDLINGRDPVLAAAIAALAPAPTGDSK